MGNLSNEDKAWEQGWDAWRKESGHGATGRVGFLGNTYGPDDLLVCCGVKAQFCTCVEAVSFWEADMTLQSYDLAYEAEGCFDCEFMGSENCPSYIDFLIALVADPAKEVYATIDTICDLFKQCEVITDDGPPEHEEETYATHPFFGEG